MAAPRSAERHSPQEIYTSLLTLYKDKQKYKAEIPFINIPLHFSSTRNLENPRNAKLKETLIQIKDDLLALQLIKEPKKSADDTSELEILDIPNNEEARKIITEKLTNLIDRNINHTIQQIIEKYRGSSKSRKEINQGIESDKTHMKLGKVHQFCLTLCPEAYIEYLWMKFFLPEGQNEEYIRRHYVSSKQLTEKIDANTMQLIESHPLYIAYCKANFDFIARIKKAYDSIVDPQKQSARVIEPFNDIKFLLDAETLMTNFLEKKEWNEEIYSHLQKIPTQFYSETNSIKKEFDQFANQIAKIMSLQNKYVYKPEAPKI